MSGAAPGRRGRLPVFPATDFQRPITGQGLALHTLPARDEVTMVSAAASALTALLREPLPPNVRTVLSSGEPVSRALADRVFANPGVRRMVNLYGPTECTVHCCAHEIARDETGEPPIGTPYARSELSVRGTDGAALGDGELGELWVAGPLVGRGYLNRPELTAERFATDAESTRHYRTGDLVRREGGRYFYEGRIDDQVKVAGFRVELGGVRGATGRTYHVKSRDRGARLSVRVTASAGGYEPGAATSAATPPVRSAKPVRHGTPRWRSHHRHMWSHH